MKNVVVVGDLVRHFITGEFFIVIENDSPQLYLYDLNAGELRKIHYSLFDLV
jgi:hypothetical protein